MERKSLPQFTKEITDRTVVGIFCVHGNVDSGGDRSWPGAFAGALEGRDRARFVWQHRTDEPPIAKVNYIREVPRAELPEKVLAWAPDATGGAEVSRTYLDTPRGSEVLAGIVAGAIDEMSYSYDAQQFDFEEQEDGHMVRNLRKMKLYDVSDVLWGMNPATTGVKAGLGTGLAFGEHSDSVVLLLDEFATRVRDRADFRAKEGRVLSGANRERISELVASLDEVSAQLKALLKETAPKADRADVLRLLADWEATKFQLNQLGV